MALADATAQGEPEQDDSHVDLDPGTVIEGRYRITGVLGEGGVGVVYSAADLRLPREVAIKVLQGRFADHASLRGRFDREARALAGLAHPNIVQVSDYGTIDGKPFVVMEKLEGRTLRELIDRGPIDPDRALAITRQLLRGLSYAHSHGLVHRDIKPGNIFLQRIDANTDLVKILDFGFAKFISGKEAADDPNLSQEGIVFGTPSYLAPEQATGATTGAQVDIYSTGVVLFEMLAGKKPFEGSLLDVVRAHLTARVPKISTVNRMRRETPDLRRLLERAMAKRPEDRFHNASTFLHAIDALPRPAIHVRARRRGLATKIALLALAFVLSIGVGHVIAQPDPRAELERLLALVGIGGGDTDDVEVGAPPAEAARPASPAAPSEPIGSLDDRSAAVIPPDDPAPEAPDTSDRGGAAEVADPGALGAGELLARVRQQIDAGEEISDETLSELRTYVRDGQDLAGAHLLLGHAYMSRRWVSNALRHYEQAHAADPRVKEDPLLLQNLIEVSATSANLDIEANYRIERVWGAEALPAVRTAMARPELPGPARHRLSRLERSLERMQPR